MSKKDMTQEEFLETLKGMTNVVEIEEDNIENNDEKSVAIYIRTSTKKQDTSIQNQKDILNRFIINKNNRLFENIDEEQNSIIKNIKEKVSIFDVYIDKISGKKSKRPEFDRMLEDAERGCFSTVYTKSISRFSRNLYFAMETIAKLEDYGVDVYFQEEDILSSDASKKLILNILATIAEQELVNTSAHLRVVTDTKRQINMLVNPIQCFGYGWKDKKQYPDLLDEERTYIIEEQAEVIKTCFNMFVLENYLITEIANHLTNIGATRKGKSKKWDYQSVYQILENEKYTGFSYKQKNYSKDFKTDRIDTDIVMRNDANIKLDFYRNEDGTLKQVCPPLISLQMYTETIKKLQTIRKENIKGKRNYHAFSSKILCGHCKDDMKYTRKNYAQKYTKKDGTISVHRKNNWVCTSYKQEGRKSGCKSISVKETFLETAFVQLLNNLLTPQSKKVLVAQKKHFKEIVKNISSANLNNQKIDDLKRKIKLNEYLITKIDNNYEMDFDDYEVLEELKYKETTISALKNANGKAHPLVNVDDLDAELTLRYNKRSIQYNKYKEYFYNKNANFYIELEQLKAENYDIVRINKNIIAINKILKLNKNDIQEWNDDIARLFTQIVNFVQVGIQQEELENSDGKIYGHYDENILIFNLSFDTHTKNVIKYTETKNNRVISKDFCTASDFSVPTEGGSIWT